jgi:DNA-binding transcriptional LysR family regulator
VISQIDLAHLRRLDFSLLLLFRELVRHRRTTVVAERIGLSQSAVSHSLTRLREIFDDPLFLRKSDGLQPTQRALELLPRVEALIKLACETVGAFDRFEPDQSDRLFRLAGNDMVCTLLGAPLIATLREAAPRVRITFRSSVGRAALDGLASDDIDLALGRFRSLPAAYDAVHLFDERFVVVARQEHPRLRRGLDLKTYLDLDHILVSFVGGLIGFADMALKRRQLSRRVVASVPMFLAAFAAVGSGDLIMTVPERIALRHAKSFGLNLYRPPLTIPGFSVMAVRHRRSQGDVGFNWLLEQVRASVNEDFDVPANRRASRSGKTGGPA